MDYTLRFTSVNSSSTLPDMNQLWSLPGTCSFTSEFPAGPDCPMSTYYNSGFATIQYLIDYSWITHLTPDFQAPKIHFNILPKGSESTDISMVLRSVVPLLMVLALSQFMNPMLMVIVAEKEKKIKQSLNVIGLRDSIFWISWFLVYSVISAVIGILATLIMRFIVVETIAIGYVLLITILFGFSMITFGFVITAMFNKAKPAAIAGGLSILLLSALYYIQVFFSDSSSSILFWFISLLSPSAFAMGLDQVRLQLKLYFVISYL